MSNIVLIHGAYQGGWIWQPLASVLRNRGHYVLAPTLEGCAERSYQLHSRITTESHAQEIANLLFFEDLKYYLGFYLIKKIFIQCIYFTE